MKAFLANAALTAASLAVALAVGEAGLRLTGYLPGNPLARLINHYDPYLGYRMIPGMHETIAGPDGVYSAAIVSLGFPDGAGFRDDGITPPVDSVFIGDSFVWGYGVELADSISKRYGALTGRDAVNLGMTSWTSPEQYARVLEKYGVPLAPRYAFMEALVENDFGDLPNFADWEASHSRKSYPEWMTDRTMHYTPGTWSYELRRFLYDHSSIGRLASDRIQFGFQDAPPPGAGGVEHVSGAGLDLFLDPRELAVSQPDQRQIAMMRAALEKSRAIAAEHGIRLVVFVAPTKELVYQDRFTDPAARAAADWRYEALIEILDETGIAHVDLLPPLRAAGAQGRQLYFARDAHWTPLAHELAARALHDWIGAHCPDAGCAP